MIEADVADIRKAIHQLERADKDDEDTRYIQ